MSIQGSGLICQKPAKLVTDFKTGLIPTDTFKDNFVGVITDDGMHLVPKCSLDSTPAAAAILVDILSNTPDTILYLK